MEQDFNFFVLNFISTFLYYTDLEVHFMPFNQVLAQLVFQQSFLQTLKYCYQNHVFVWQLFLGDVYHAVLLFVCKVVLDVCLEVNKLVLHVYRQKVLPLGRVTHFNLVLSFFAFYLFSLQINVTLFNGRRVFIAFVFVFDFLSSSDYFSNGISSGWSKCTAAIGKN